MAELLGGKYEVLDLAGEGGMAKVYRGRTHGAGGFTRRVAIKRVLTPLTQNAEFLKMFVEEARVVSELEHPNIAQIHDFDRDRFGEYYLVLEWVEGLTLAQWRQAHQRVGKVTPWTLVTAIGIEVLRALHAAHDRHDRDGNLAPIYHRDVTPQNVMISTAGAVKLTDFGLARAMDRSRMTKPGFVKGKIAYLAPELSYEGEPTARTDIFSTGVVLWEILAGEKLFKGDDPAKVIRTIREGEIPALSEKRSDVPTELQRVVSKALEREPTARYADARSMRRDLANLLRQTGETTDSELIARNIKWAQKELGLASRDRSATKKIPVRRAAELAGAADETFLDPSIPLTRRKRGG